MMGRVQIGGDGVDEQGYVEECAVWHEVENDEV